MNRIVRLSEAPMAHPVDPETAVGQEAFELDPMHLRIVEALLFATVRKS